MALRVIGAGLPRTGTTSHWPFEVLAHRHQPPAPSTNCPAATSRFPAFWP